MTWQPANHKIVQQMNKIWSIQFTLLFEGVSGQMNDTLENFRKKNLNLCPEQQVQIAFVHVIEIGCISRCNSSAWVSIHPKLFHLPGMLALVINSIQVLGEKEGAMIDP
jgi:hypothetical protein